MVGSSRNWRDGLVAVGVVCLLIILGTMQLSGGLSGTYTYTGPFNAHGTGTYTISLPEGIGKAGTMTGGGAGSAEGYTNTGVEKYTLTPIEPCN